MVPRQPGMAESDRRATEPHESPMVQSPERSGMDTRRTSNSSMGVRSDPSRTADMQASYSSIVSDTQRSRPRPPYGSMRGESTTQQQPFPSSLQMLSPQTAAPPRRPGAGRRAPSSAHPHRGEVFSTDDDPDEVDLDLRLARSQTREAQQAAQREREREQQRQERQMRRHDSTVRRRPVAQAPSLPMVESDEREEQAQTSGNDVMAAAAAVEHAEAPKPSSDETTYVQEEEEEEEEEELPEEESPDPDSDDADLSDAESFTLKDRQEAINEAHPFGIRIWKPALYKKSRSVQRNAEGDIHSAPGGNVSWTLVIFNCLWSLIFGWWLAIIAAAGGFLCMILSIFRLPGCHEYGRVLINLSHYLWYPFGKYVKLERDEAYMDEDEGEGRSITEYEQWQTGDIEEGRLFFGPTDINRSIIGRRREEVAGLDEGDSLLGRHRRESASGEPTRTKIKKRLFGRGQWNIGRVIFFLSFYFLITPCLFLVSAVCWFFVFTIPMGKVTLLLFYHLRRHPLAMSFHTDSHYMRSEMDRGTAGSSILLCTYRAVGLRYWKYTVDGTNIFLINLLVLVAFTIFDYYVLSEALGIVSWVTNMGFIFLLALLSVIPLAYFIGQAVASISAQSSMGVGATVNALFSTIVEVYLYCVALKQGKGQLVEGSIVGSVFAGILFLPGLSMCFGAIKRKTQRFNVASAGVTTTMLLFAMIAAFSPTLFYQIYGSHEMKCHQCFDVDSSGADRDCRRCYFSQTPAIHSKFYQEALRPFIWFATFFLFMTYLIGCLFTLRTHAAVIWNNEPDEKKDVKMELAAQRVDDRYSSQEDARNTLRRPPFHTMETAASTLKDSQMYKRILNQSLRQAGINSGSGSVSKKPDENSSPHLVPPKTPEAESGNTSALDTRRIAGLSAEDNRALVEEIAEMAAMAATVAARDATSKVQRNATPRTTTNAQKPHGSISSKDAKEHHGSGSSKDTRDSAKYGAISQAPEINTLGFENELTRQTTHAEEAQLPVAAGAGQTLQEAGGHDAPNWSRKKSATVLFVATAVYAVIAEILVDTVDSVLGSSSIDQKFLGITLFALVPNTTEFLNAIAFAMNGNVALSMEIGSSYALQVMLLQIPAVVMFSIILNGYILAGEREVLEYSFTLIFPQWDVVTIVLGVFLMGWVVGEGKSNYFKGSILIFTYLVFVVGFYFAGFNNGDVNPGDTLALGANPSFQQVYQTSGRGRSGMAWT